MPAIRPRLRLLPVPIVLGLLVVAALLPAPVRGAEVADLAAAETSVVRLLNARRTELGLVPLRVDARLRDVARARSLDMVTRGYFGHETPEGDMPWDLVGAAGIEWYAVGEVLAWNTIESLTDSAANAAQQWRNSSGHDEIVTDAKFNYFAVGVAVDAVTGKRIWTALTLRGPDRTKPWAAVSSATAGSMTSTTVRVTLSWTGADRPLSALTAGLRDYRVQHRVNGSAWRTVWSVTTATSRGLDVALGRRHEFRVRSVDKAGNVGSWSEPLGIDV